MSFPVATSRRRLRPLLLRLLWAAFVACALLVFGAGLGVVWATPGEGCPAHGLFVGGRIPPQDPALGAWLENRRRQIAAKPVALIDGLDVYETTLGEIGVELDVAATMQAALRPSRVGSLRERARSLLLARYGMLDVPLSYSVDLRRAEVGLRPIADGVRRAAMDARIDLTRHERLADVPGVEIDVLATAHSVMVGVLEGQGTFFVKTRPVVARVTLADLDAVDVTQVAASFETRFSVRGGGKRRARNIALAAAAIDGLVLEPGQAFSFNTVVGRRTLERGYTWAPVIVGDELRPGIGGGICQVASTLYASALYAAMQITERWAHGRPSHYTRLGLDATVSYPSKDLRFVNSLPYSVILHIYFPQQGVIRAEVLGGAPVADVQYRYGVAKTTPFVRRIVRKPWLRADRAIRKQKGIKGYSVVSRVRLDFGTRVDERVYHSEYRPTPEIFWVGPGYDEEDLPALPSGAEGVEGRLSRSPQEGVPAG